MIYANGAKLLKLSTIAVMQYLVPSMIFLTAIFVFHEPLSTVKLVSFSLIWLALVIYTVPMLRRTRAVQPSPPSPPASPSE